MRISIVDVDPAYHPDAVRCRVFFNGLRLRGCVTADEERGFALCHIERNGGETLDVAWWRGEVRIRYMRINGDVRIWVPDWFDPTLFGPLRGPVLEKWRARNA